MIPTLVYLIWVFEYKISESCWPVVSLHPGLVIRHLFSEVLAQSSVCQPTVCQQKSRKAHELSASVSVSLFAFMMRYFGFFLEEM